MAKRNEDKPRRTITPLPGWVSLPKAARTLKVTRARTFQMVDEYVFKEVHLVEGTGDRPAVILVRESEVAELKRLQEAAEAARAAAEAEAAAKLAAAEEPALVA